MKPLMAWRPKIGANRPVTWFLVVLTGFAHFLHARGFGLYEDDYHYIANYLDADLTMIGDLAARALLEWPQGRPLQSIVPPLLTVLLFPLGGLLPLYAAAFAITAVSVVLFHRLAVRVTASALTALIGAVMFGLFPADTTHPFLMHALVLRPALVCALGASLLYIQGRRWPSYLLAFVGLTLYETPILVFLGAPCLMLAHATPSGRRELLRHGAVCALLIAITIALRWFNGEERLAAAHGELIEILARLPEQMLFGAGVSLRQMTYGPVKRLGGWDAMSLLLIVPAALLFYSKFGHVLKHDTSGPASSSDGCNRRDLPSCNAGSSPWPLTGACLLLLLLAYLLSFTHQPWFIYGRLTSVHLAASVGGSLLFAMLAVRALCWAPTEWVRRAVLGILALHFAILLGYRHTIQNDFVRSWQLQRWYWSNLVAQTPDLIDATVVLVDGTAMPMTRYIRTNSWCDPLLLPLLFRIPADWRNAPVALPLFQETRLEQQHDVLGAYFADLPGWYPLTPGNVVLLRREGGRLRRDQQPEAHIQGFTVPLRSSGDNNKGLETRPLYRLLIAPQSPMLPPR